MKAVPFCEITPESLARFHAAVGDLARFTRKETSQVVHDTAITFAFQAIKHTPIAAKGIKNRGFAKQAWIWVARALGAQPREDYPGGANIANLYYDTVDRRNAETPYIEVANSIPYIVELDQGSRLNPPQHILARTLNSTTGKLKDRLFRLQWAMQKRWNR